MPYCSQGCGKHLWSGHPGGGQSGLAGEPSHQTERQHCRCAVQQAQPEAHQQRGHSRYRVEDGLRGPSSPPIYNEKGERAAHYLTECVEEYVLVVEAARLPVSLLVYTTHKQNYAIVREAEAEPDHPQRQRDDEDSAIAEQLGVGALLGRVKQRIPIPAASLGVLRTSRTQQREGRQRDSVHPRRVVYNLRRFRSPSLDEQPAGRLWQVQQRRGRDERDGDGGCVGKCSPAPLRQEGPGQPGDKERSQGPEVGDVYEELAPSLVGQEFSEQIERHVHRS
mmetsp:Transcript_34965/g.77112  ORF Transcript_34965/g.77112 Transcript_34965/m.77112 type:complete len:279 (+) Transcript_34965:688-1524(+)